MSNDNTKITDLDFVNIKTNFINYLKQQDTFKDYNFAGSGLSVLLDVLTYNTQYNAYYLNMVANEMFLDSALQRDSVVSHAKEIGYIPKSALAPSAVVDISVTGINPLTTTLTLPKFSTFLSEAINGRNYNFVTTDIHTAPVSGGTATFTDVTIKQGRPGNYNFTYNETSNPKALFTLEDSQIDTTTLVVFVYPNPTNDYYETYTLAEEFLTLDGTSQVYFLQEGNLGNYEIYFGDNILGKKITDGSRVVVSYLITQGTAAEGANNFVLTTSIGGSADVNPVTEASAGGEKESIESIRYQAPKSYAAQKRAVTEEDYITAIQQNTLGYSFDAVSAWGGQQNDPPVYGQVFISLKPSGAYSLTDTQKQRILTDVIRPISVMTVEPTIVDPDYTYLKIDVNVVYDPKKTPLTGKQIQNSVNTSIRNFAANTLNTFNSTFLLPDLNEAIKSTDVSIITNESSIQVQKKFYPILTVPSTYKFYYGVGLEKGMFTSGITNSPPMSFRDPDNLSLTIENVMLEEIPTSTGGIESISIINPGFSYQRAPIVTITGDGSGATAVATITKKGAIKSITIVDPGRGYTSAVVKITPRANDTTGKLGTAIANVEGRYGKLRLYYINNNGVKTILRETGTVDYEQGIITLESFNPLDVADPLGQLTITANPKTTIISSTYNRIITVSPFDSTAVTVNVTAKT